MDVATRKKKAEPQGLVEQPKQTIVCYKGFDENLRCRDFQYEIGKTYKHEGAVECCASGFHSCEYPLDCFGYYEPGTSRYAIVEIGGAADKDDGDTKICSAEITIKAEIQVPEIITRAIAWVTALCKPADSKHSEGYQSASSATGTRSASSATGYQSASSATGYRSASSATGDRSASSATGYRSASSATGYRSASSATGDGSASSATGYRSASSATGYGSASSATGYRSASSATGNRSASSATGDQSASSATGYGSASSATGDQSASLTTGSYSKSEVLKPDSHSVAIGVGYKNKAKAAKGCALVLCYRDSKNRVVHIRASKVGENGIKADTWYALDASGEFVEAA
jgi:hypothetical protein